MNEPQNQLILTECHDVLAGYVELHINVNHVRLLFAVLFLILVHNRRCNDFSGWNDFRSLQVIKVEGLVPDIRIS